MQLSLIEASPPVIAALHLADFALSRHRPMAWFEYYAIVDDRVFAEAGVPWIKLQDQTRTAGAAAPERLAMMAALGRLIQAEFPQFRIGIIVEAHNPTAALPVAHAAGAEFLRLKVLVGGGVSDANVGKALAASDGVIGSSALMRRDAAEDDLVRCDADRCRRFTDAARAA